MTSALDQYETEFRKATNNLLIDVVTFILEKYKITDTTPEKITSEWSGHVVVQEKIRRSRSAKVVNSSKVSKIEENIKEMDGFVIPINLYPSEPGVKQSKQFIKADVFTSLDENVRKSICNWNFTKSKDNPNTYCGGFPVDNNSMCSTCCKKSSKNKKSDETNGSVDEKSCITGLSVGIPTQDNTVKFSTLTKEMFLSKTTVEGILMPNHFGVNNVLIKIIDNEKIAIGVTDDAACTSNETVISLPSNWEDNIKPIPLKTKDKLNKFNVKVKKSLESEDKKTFTMSDLV